MLDQDIFYESWEMDVAVGSFPQFALKYTRVFIYRRVGG